MENSYATFWRRNTSKIFSVTVLWGLILSAPAAFLLICYHLAGINVGILLDEHVGQKQSYWIILLVYMLGMTGGTLLWLPSVLRIFVMKWQNAFTMGAFALYVLFFLGAQLALECFVVLRRVDIVYEDNTVAWALIMLSVIGMLVTLRVWHKTRTTAT